MRPLPRGDRLAPTTRASGRPPVTRERIAEAALTILDGANDEGALTMRTLGRELGVQAPSLYAHVSGIDDVIDLVHERINASIDLSVLDDEDPLAGLAAFAHLYRAAYGRHRTAAAIIITRSINADHALVVYERIADCLVRAGVPLGHVMPVMALLDNVTLGSAIEPFSDAFVGPLASYRKSYPILGTALQGSHRSRIDDDGFEMGLNALLDIVRSLGGR